MKVLHIDTGWTWRGGQQQVFLLHRELLKNGVDSRLIARSDGELIVRCRKENLPVDPIVSPRPWNPLAIGNIWRHYSRPRQPFGRACRNSETVEAQNQIRLP